MENAMSEDMTPSTPQGEALPEPWINIWAKALTKPSVETFERISESPHATTRRAYNWIFIAGAIGTAVIFLISIGLGSDPGFFGSMLLTLICLVPVSGLFAVLGLIISAGLSQAIATMLGGEGSFAKLAYTIASYAAPLSLVSAAVSTIPFVQCLGIPLGIFGIVLNVAAIKAVNKFSWGKAILSSVVILIGILLLVAAVVIIGLALLGPAIGNVFQNIIDNMPAQ
jgi:hypothetical protein